MRVLVIGSGGMGNGIAQVFALAGHQVFLNDINMRILESASLNIKAQLTLMCQTGLITESDIETTLKNIHLSDKLNDCAPESDLVIEAIPEKLELKESLFKRLDSLCPEHAIFATNTSGISINTLADSVRRKDKFIGTHFFMPAHLVPLVEVVCGQQTSDETVETVMKVLSEADKKPVRVAHDLPGFIANRLQHALAREAMSLVQKGIASPEGIDEVVKSSLAIRMLFTGPLEQRDFNGLDTHLSIASYLYSDLEDSHTPLKILADKVSAGKLGVKTGEGFYDWSAKDKEQVIRDKNSELIDVLKFIKNRAAK